MEKALALGDSSEPLTNPGATSLRFLVKWDVKISGA